MTRAAVPGVSPHGSRTLARAPGVPILVALGAGLALLASRVALIPLGPPRAALTLLIFGSILVSLAATAKRTTAPNALSATE